MTEIESQKKEWAINKIIAHISLDKNAILEIV